jgi:23S rRNA (guanosine2251-2'-O)-methyltransferase
MPEQSSYEDKKAFFSRVLTVYGRKPVLEALCDDSLQCHALHLARSNRNGVESLNVAITAGLIAYANYLER